MSSAPHVPFPVAIRSQAVPTDDWRSRSSSWDSPLPLRRRVREPWLYIAAGTGGWRGFSSGPAISADGGDERRFPHNHSSKYVHDAHA